MSHTFRVKLDQSHVRAARWRMVFTTPLGLWRIGLIVPAIALIAWPDPGGVPRWLLMGLGAVLLSQTHQPWTRPVMLGGNVDVILESRGHCDIEYTMKEEHFRQYARGEVNISAGMVRGLWRSEKVWILRVRGLFDCCVFPTDQLSDDTKTALVEFVCSIGGRVE